MPPDFLIRIIWTVLPVASTLSLCMLRERFRLRTPLDREQTWGCAAVTLALGMVFGANFLLVAFRPLERLANDSLLGLELLSFVPTLLYISPVLFIVLRRQRSLRGLGFDSRHALSLIAAATAGYFAFVFLWAARRYLAGKGWDPLYTNPQFGETPAMAPIGYSILFVALVVVGASVDEIVFRGFALIPLARVLGPFAAIIATALFWSMAHFADLQRTLTFFLEGLVYGWVFYRTGSLFPSLTFHILANLGSVSDFAFARMLRAGIRWTDWEHFLFLGLGSLGLSIAGGCVALLTRSRRRSDSP